MDIGWFYSLAIVNRAVVNIGEPVSLVELGDTALDHRTYKKSLLEPRDLRWPWGDRKDSGATVPKLLGHYDDSPMRMDKYNSHLKWDKSSFWGQI